MPHRNRWKVQIRPVELTDLPASAPDVLTVETIEPMQRGADDFDLSGMMDTAHRPQWPPAATTAVKVGGGCAGLVLLQFFAIWLVVTVTLNARVPRGVSTRVASPERGVVGKSVPVRVTVANDGTKPVKVRSITARSTVLRRFRIENPRPAPRESSSMFSTNIWVFDHEIQPGKKWTATFDATPLQEGTLKANLEVQVGAGMLTAPFTLEVRSDSTRGPTSQPSR